MDLSSLIGGGVKPYLEFGWVCPLSAAGQPILANTVTTLSCNTKVTDTGGYGAINNSNQITLSAGTYYYKVNCRFGSTTGEVAAGSLSLYNVSTNQYVTTKPLITLPNGAYSDFDGQITTTALSTFDIRTGSRGYTYSNTGWDYSYGPGTVGIANSDQRTTIKLWKLA